uniref:ANF_receptor domain-containing protein n=1 Tax=Strongyloides papillosus TaxID=174720 RepID=A0A0N5BWF7_STREA
MIRYNQVTIILVTCIFIFLILVTNYGFGEEIYHFKRKSYKSEKNSLNPIEDNDLFNEITDNSRKSINLHSDFGDNVRLDNRNDDVRRIKRHTIHNELYFNEENKSKKKHYKIHRKRHDRNIVKSSNDYEVKPFYILIPLPEKANEAPECKYRNPFNLDLLSVRPVIEEAIEDIQSKIFGSRKIRLVPFFNDTKCSDAIGPNFAVELYKQEKLDCIIGYAFVYSLATISRLSTQWKNGIPIISPIGLTSNLDNKTEYKYLTRITGSYKGVGSATSKIMKTLNITNVLFLLHEPRLVRTQDIPYSECFHIIGSLIYELVNNNNFIKKQDSYDVIDETLHNTTIYKEKLKKLSIKGNGMF